MFFEIYVLLFLLGAIFGSFANVCIYRLPLEQSIVTNRSHCPHCKKKISWFFNIPIFSYLYLQGKCFNCKKKISSQYLIVEIISALSFLGIYYMFGLSIEMLLLIFIFSIYLIIFFIDLKHFIIPNSLNFMLIISGFFKNFIPQLDKFLFSDLISSIIGGIIGYAMIWGIIKLYKKLKNIEGMGLGDAKLFCAIGLWFGYQSVFIIIFLASIIALIVIAPKLMMGKIKMKNEIPFGPFIIIGNLVYLIFMDEFFNFLSMSQLQ
jgi:leader peptidase (prepilin peptidase)/N-methyltransferase